MPAGAGVQRAQVSEAPTSEGLTNYLMGLTSWEVGWEGMLEGRESPKQC